ncbi:hypothetical protein GV794_18580 [Nocardia cyriacigeorgica]|uniref:Uncharacterized protein n=1 Tax=Nocardia cyriacigeorgica TaxID=135487 RepID=A0ABX0CNI7_9NOCA|nr:hypothetical protein [Nocardia cyriacigeorgica]NEW38207.1 hypothetical protein [Nocardia cyriacigeorgica]NEW57646.1 hypothetical protein [Nocardia cyriacigeorgica]
MTSPRIPLADLLIAGLTASTTAAERAAAVRPPYPVPAAIAPIRDHVLRELEVRLPPDGDGPRTVTRALGPVESYRETVRVLGLPRRALFDFDDAACALIAVGALAADDVEDLAPFLPTWCGYRRQLVLNRLAAGDLAGARASAAELEDEYRWRAYRDIGAELAVRGDATGFFAEWRHYAIAREREDLAELAKLLVAGVAGREGWNPAPAGGLVEDLQRVVDGHAAGVLPELDQLVLLSAAIRSVTDPCPQRDHPLLDRVVDRLVAIGPAAGKAAVHRRDAELAALWPAIGNRDTLARIRQAVQTPGFRENLTMLPRDAAPAGSD